MLVEDWQGKRHNWEAVKEMFKNPRYVFVVSTFQQANWNYFYWSAIDTLKAFNEYTQRHFRIYQITDGLFFFCCVLMAIVVVYLGLRNIQKSMVNVYSTLVIMPLYLVQRNKVLSVRLGKLMNCEVSDIF